MTIRIVSVLAITILLSACSGENPTAENAPHIQMGDPATIVTETDSAYLRDAVSDLNMNTSRPVTIAEAKPDTANTPAKDTAKTQQPGANTASTNGNGLKVPFPQVTFFIPGIGTKTYKEPNLETDFGASYELVSGNLNGNSITIQGENITDVSMRYQTIVVARNDIGTLPLESLRKLTDWKKVQGKNGVYQISGLDEKKLEGLKVSNKAIRNAVSRDAKSRNWSRKNIEQWLASVRKTNSTNQKPLHIELRSVMWKVSGKDKNGRPYQRQLRIDVPLKP